MKKIENLNFDIMGFEIKVIVTDPLWKQNCYLVTNKQNGEQVLIDPGNGADTIKAKIRENGDGTLKSIFLTHAHFDHIGAVSEIMSEFEAPCYLHESDYRLMRQATMYIIKFGGKPFKIPDHVNTFSGADEVEYLKNIDVVTFSTPGHTKGSVCYQFEGFIFTGDTLLFESVGRADLPESNLSELRESIDMLLNAHASDFVIFSGHGRQWNTSEAKVWWKEARTLMPQHNMFLK
jgi:hydroxyacylglutathione hydrolase